jgi:hypothetical protein
VPHALPISLSLVLLIRIINYFLFLVITWRKVVWNRRFGSIYRFHLQEWSCSNLTLEDRTRWNRKTDPKRQSKTVLRDIITQKTEEFSSTAAEAQDVAPEWRLVRSTERVAPHCALFSIFLLLPASQTQLSFSSPNLPTPSACILSLMEVTKFHTHAQQREKLCCRFLDNRRETKSRERYWAFPHLFFCSR